MLQRDFLFDSTIRNTFTLKREEIKIYERKNMFFILAFIAN